MLQTPCLFVYLLIGIHFSACSIDSNPGQKSSLPEGEIRGELLQADQNSKSKEVGILKSKGESADNIFSDLKILSDKIKELEKEQRELSLSLKDALQEIPNVPHSSCPKGFSDKDNVVIKALIAK